MHKRTPVGTLSWQVFLQALSQALEAPDLKIHFAPAIRREPAADEVFIGVGRWPKGSLEGAGLTLNGKTAPPELGTFASVTDLVLSDAIVPWLEAANEMNPGRFLEADTGSRRRLTGQLFRADRNAGAPSRGRDRPNPSRLGIVRAPVGDRRCKSLIRPSVHGDHCRVPWCMPNWTNWQLKTT